MDISVTFEQEKTDFQADFGQIQVRGEATVEPYMGAYEVTPTLQGLTMGTENKRMVQDTVIRPIPIYTVSNNSGGTTVTIG